MSRRINRRAFLKTTAVAGTGFWIASGFELEGAQPRRPGPNDRLNIGIIGAGGQGGSNLGNVARLGENIVALCDVDDRRAAKAYAAHPKATRYSDFRVMLDKQKNLDAVTVSTPDHQHAIAAITAMNHGKHVYCEKPLTHDVWEARQMRLAAAKNRVATQMGNQGTSNNNFRTAVEIIRAGGLGEVREVHVWTNRPIWPQGMQQRPPAQEVPQGVHWDLWLGTAPTRPYNQAYLPFAWRGWWDFGTGALGDMACHTMNLPYMALQLGQPTTVVARRGRLSPESPPGRNEGCTITYDFPARDKLPPVRLYWYEGNDNLPPRSLFHGQRAVESGALIVGSRGTMYSPSDYGGSYRLLPEGNFKGYQPPKPTLPRSPGHHAEWIRACKGGPAAMSNFDYAGPFTEVVLLGNVAIRVGQRINWDSENLRARELPAADPYIRRQYRKGWTLG
jgi:predicted dehydrogenase